MTKKTRSFRSAALAGAAVAALSLAPAIAWAQAPRPDFPGAKQGDFDAAQSPRPDFPGAKQGEVDPAQSPRPDFPGPKQGDSSQAQPQPQPQK
jgi:hypothetical protein